MNKDTTVALYYPRKFLNWLPRAWLLRHALSKATPLSPISFPSSHFPTTFLIILPKETDLALLCLPLIKTLVEAPTTKRLIILAKQATLSVYQALYPNLEGLADEACYYDEPKFQEFQKNHANTKFSAIICCRSQMPIRIMYLMGVLCADLKISRKAQHQPLVNLILTCDHEIKYQQSLVGYFFPKHSMDFLESAFFFHSATTSDGHQDVTEIPREPFEVYIWNFGLGKTSSQSKWVEELALETKARGHSLYILPGSFGKAEQDLPPELSSLPRLKKLSPNQVLQIYSRTKKIWGTLCPAFILGIFCKTQMVQYAPHLDNLNLPHFFPWIEIKQV